MGLIYALFIQGLQMVLVLVLAPGLLGFTRKVRARLHRRQGPPIVQPYRDLYRLVHKEVVLADNATWLFRNAPYLIFATTWVAAALVPTFASGLHFSWAADLIAITALLGSARFFLALAGMDIGTAFGGIGSSREMLFSTLAEPAMIMLFFTVSLVAGSLGAIASLAWFAAYAMQNAAAVRTVGMSEVLFSLLVSRGLFRERMSGTEKAGMALVVLGIVVLCAPYL